MEFSVPIFIIVLLLGVLQLAVGVVFGRCLPVGKSKSPRPDPRDPRKLRQFAERLYRLVDGVANDVGRHQTRIKRVNRKLASIQSKDGDGLTELVLNTVAQIMQINERLQQRLSEAEEKLQQQTKQVESHLAEARTDPLTGLPNRRAFDDELVRRIAEWQRKHVTFCLVWIDIDHFKRLNDEHGHPAGDHLLRAVSEVLGNIVREMDLVARIGGEEFAVILPSTNSREAMQTVERIRSAVAAEQFVFEGAKLALTLSLGLAMIERDDNCVSLIKRADEALYCAKRAGRNCGFFHNGQRCQQIKLSAKTTAPAASPGEEGSDSSDSMVGTAKLVAICHDLRQRLAEVADEATPSPNDEQQHR